MADDPFFIGWSPDISKPDRRFLLLATLGIVVGGSATAAFLGGLGEAPGPGIWNQSAITDHTGLLLTAPWPALRMIGADGHPQTAFLATTGKRAVRLAADAQGWVKVRGSLISRGQNRMIAVDGARWLGASGGAEPPGLRNWPETDLGPAEMIGEILDAKCWFGAMRPGYGKTHKACATLCARGGLPLAFCAAGSCGSGVDAPLFLDADGRRHDPAILPFIADRVIAKGRMVRVGDVTQFRVARSDLYRI